MKNSTKNLDLHGHGFPERLRKLRTERRLTKTDLAAEAGLTYRTVHDLETGHRERAQERTLLLMAEALDVPLEELLGVAAESARAAADGAGIRHRRSRRTAAIVTAVVLATIAIGGLRLWSYAMENAEFEQQGKRVLVARDALFGIRLWGIDNSHHLSQVKVSPWRSDRLLVPVGGQTENGGCLLCLDRASGDTIWVARPDIDAVVRAFGAEDVLAAQFSAKWIEPADLDGDGKPEIVVSFCHGRYYPFLVCVVDESGRVVSQYANKGHVLDYVITDLDGDGCDEFLGAGTNNAKAYQGATLFILDRDHWRGASVDSLCDPWSTEPDSALVRLVVPQYPAPYMDLIQETRLHATHPRVHRDANGKTLISAYVGSNQKKHVRVLLFLDGALNPTGCEPEDGFVERWISQWPDSLTNGTGPGDAAWRAAWLATARRFEAGHRSTAN